MRQTHMIECIFLVTKVFLAENQQLEWLLFLFCFVIPVFDLLPDQGFRNENTNYGNNYRGNIGNYRNPVNANGYKHNGRNVRGNGSNRICFRKFC